MTTLLIDSDIILMQAAARATTDCQWDDEVYTHTMDLREAIETVKDNVLQLRRELGGERCVMALSDHKANWRKEVLPSYKSNRKGRKPPGYARLEAWLEKNFETWAEPALEADDILGLLSTGKRIKGRKVVVSSDKDLQTIPGLLYNPGKPALGVREISVDDADLYHLTQALTGDTVDGYKGCPGVGPVAAEKLLAGLTTNEERWEAIVSAYEKKGLTAEDALTQARVARILRHGEYTKKGGVKLWTA